ncbi:MAG: F0F1 ATP synthase subunit alpha [Chloroflexi bacterium]|nr:F0F1 ATP synthase subunit alpha [Chloroflexota bacterium]
MAVRGHDIASIIKDQIQKFGAATEIANVGTVMEVGDGIARIHGLSGAKASELLEFKDGTMALVLNLEEDSVAAVVLGDYSSIREGAEVRSTGKVVEVPVGEGLLGRVVNPLGVPLDGRGSISFKKTRPVEKIAPNVVTRQPVNTPVLTGIKAIDSMVPIGRGQRELIIGDRFTGKSALAIDTIINQKGGNLICIYVAIGQKSAKVAQVVGALESHGVMQHTIVVAANAADPAPLQYLAPYAGCAIGEEFMDAGKDALVIYDDLSKHAWAYRQLSLLLRRPPGREAYPGDVFYLHSRLLERAARMAPEFGGGSLTALPIIETLAGDVSAYIPTNVISITDGQIYLESDMFNAGVRPAINAGLSVSRVGGSAQTKAMRKVAGRIRTDLAQYRELAAFAQFGTADLDKATRAQLERGQRTIEVLKQARFAPMAVEHEVMILYALINGALDDVPVARVSAFEAAFHRYMDATYPQVGKAILTDKDLSKETEEALKQAIAEFKKTSSFA